MHNLNTLFNKYVLDTEKECFCQTILANIGRYL